MRISDWSSDVCSSDLLTAAADHVFVAGELLRPDGTAGVQLAGRNADLRTHAELAAVGELGRGVVQDDAAVDAREEALGNGRILGDDRLRVVRSVALDMSHGGIRISEEHTSELP